jgi:hypothetical protein
MTYHDATTIYYIILTVWIHWIITCDMVILLHRFQQTQHLVVFKHQAMPRTAPRFIKYNLMRSLHEQEQWLDCRLSRHIETMQLFDAGNGWKWCNLRGKISVFVPIESPGVEWQWNTMTGNMTVYVESMWSVHVSSPCCLSPDISRVDRGWKKWISTDLCLGLRMSLRYWSLRMRCMGSMRSLQDFEESSWRLWWLSVILHNSAN